MSERKIPAKTVTVCDVCGNEREERKLEGRIEIKQKAINITGDLIGDGSQEWDLCDRCL